ncbi:MAG: hypothetical protein H6829_01635 [Planctomycetes bacterium]|nr:hypothetical protein [Planctomycetota bacterium]
MSRVLEGIRQVIVAKGKKVVRFDLAKDAPEPAELEAVLLGPTGNLRAPTMRMGKTLLVGFQEALYGEVFGA